MSDSEELRAFLNELGKPSGVPWLDALESSHIEAMLGQLETVVNAFAESDDWPRGLAVWTELLRLSGFLADMTHFARGRMEATQFRLATKRRPSKRADKADAQAFEVLETLRARARHWGEWRDRG
jgi:hypothetical protein